MSAAAPNSAPAGRVSDHVLLALARATANAKAGSIEAMAIITVDGAGRPRVEFAGAGELFPQINLGLDMAKFSALGNIGSAPGATTMNSGIVMPDPGHG